MAEKMAIAFGTKFVIQKSLISRSFRKTCQDKGIPSIVYEGGESIRLDGFSIEVAKNGIKRTLQALGMIETQLPEVNTPRYLVTKTTWIRAPHAGIFIWSRESGARVQKGEPMGVIKDPYGNKSITVHSTASGFIIGHNNASVVNHGDALFNIGKEFNEIS